MVYYHKESLFFNKLKLEALAKKFGSPIYVYDLDAIASRVQELSLAFDERVEIHYALKANANPILLSKFKKLGLGADTVSWGEILLALKAGFKPENIIFSGIGKTEGEIENAIRKNVYQINVESPQELERIGKVSKKLKKNVRLAFRMNPDVNPQTHPYITTGFRENKFGMDVSFLSELKIILAKYKTLKLQGLTLHIGSQLLEFDSIFEAIKKTIPIFKDLRASGFDMQTFDIGGGVGIPYDGGMAPDLKKYGSIILEALKPLNCKILTEPGRLLVGPFGVLVTKVEYVKSSPNKSFAIVDTGMHHLIRPPLYKAHHRVWPLTRRHEDKHHYDVVGPICESSDFLAKDVELHGLEQGDYLAILDTGAYGYSMASFYNAHKLPKEIVIEKGKARVSTKSSVLDYFKN